MCVAVAEIGPQTPDIAMPISALGMSSSQMFTSGDSIREYRNSANANSTRPGVAMNFGLILSISRPMTGARAPEKTAVGASIRADSVGVRPRTVWK